MYPFKLHSNGVLAICPKNKPFFAETLKAEKQWRCHLRLELKSYNHSFSDERLLWQSYKIIFNEPDPAGLTPQVLTVRISNRLKQHDEFTQKAIVKFHGQGLILPKRFMPNTEFLQFHRENVFTLN
jgi:hypothetical protein